MATHRRNGQLSSCEPCRKGKLRCDHKTPICGRCARRNQASLCIYHPAPMTKSRPPAATQQLKPAVDLNRRRSRKRQSQSLGPNAPSVSEPSKSPSHEPAAAAAAAAATAAPDGFPDPYLTDWNNASANLNPNPNGSGTNPSTPAWLGLPPGHQGVFPGYDPGLAPVPFEEEEEAVLPILEDALPVDPGQVELGAQLLLLLDDLPLYQAICDARYDSLFDPWVFGAQFVRDLVQSIHQLYHRSLQDQRKDKHLCLTELCQEIFNNSRNPIVVHPDMTFAEYVSVIAHRWEGIGLLFAITGTSSHHLQGGHQVFQPRDGKPAVEKHALQALMAATAGTCIQLCENLGVMSEPLTWLLFQQTILASLAWGVADYRAWKMLGEASTLALALGLHQPNPGDRSAPFFLVELRRRVMTAGYIIDKELAGILGRPPRISHRHCDLQLPLDLSYAEMTADMQTRDMACSKLDAHGWNTEGLLSKGTRPRVGQLIAMLRENVLEVTLCRQIDTLPQQIEELCHKNRQMREQLPPFLQLKPIESNLDHSTVSLDDITVQLIHIDFLYNEFLLYHLLTKRTGMGSDQLINIAYEVLSTTLDRIAEISKPNRTFQSIVHVDYPLCQYALPCAGVLSLELLRHSQLPIDPALSSTFPRNEIIQKLSILVFFLESYVPPGEANYKMSQQARKGIQSTLDQLLSPQPMLEGAFMGGTEMLLPLGNGADFMAWLDSLDWGQDPWLNLT
ncbi:putative chromatin structure remodeling complex protein RSC3 [Aspergillus ellipticus CBS 707.79]|uniref:Putative chromatin structure remodeling complex protein RSC3 n=1 Tax=Aspergillus ellipticus CBS 707.79 TaxID=1448320 RepID=A0A319D5I3_9EURO|nr:putative chromatin structure remodeling complex protein RSC3 [Aspergillus ellipticus CBS 707.79]